MLFSPKERGQGWVELLLILAILLIGMCLITVYAIGYCKLFMILNLGQPGEC